MTPRGPQAVGILCQPGPRGKDVSLLATGVSACGARSRERRERPWSTRSVCGGTHEGDLVLWSRALKDTIGARAYMQEPPHCVDHGVRLFRTTSSIVPSSSVPRLSFPFVQIRESRANAPVQGRCPLPMVG
jgi:hypothetical protein